MRFVLFFLVSVFLMLQSCNDYDDSVSKRFPESLPATYALVSIKSMSRIQKESPVELPFEERYVFNGDNTFTKTKFAFSAGEQSTSGTYSLNIQDDEQILMLALQNPELGNNCSDPVTETFTVIDENEIVNKLSACDRGDYVYIRTNN